MDEDWLPTPPRFASGEEQAIFLSSCEILQRAWAETRNVNADTYFSWKEVDGVKFVAFRSFYEGYFIDGDSPYVQCDIQNGNVDFSACLKGYTDQPARVHKGALNIFLHILQDSNLKTQMEELSRQKKDQKEEQPIIFVGHSIGGAIATLATICFLDMSLKNIYPLCITFGSPLVGNTDLRESIGREDWLGRFCHVVSKYDVVPRMLLAPFESIAQHLNSIFPQIESIMEIVSVHLSHPSTPDPGVKFLQDVGRDAKSSLYKPFGTYMFCSSYGAACIEDSQAALEMLVLTLQRTEENDIAGALIPENTSYGDMLKHVIESGYSTRTANIVSESSMEMGIALQLQAMGFRTQNKSAFDALKEAEDLKNKHDMDIENRNAELSDKQSRMAQLEWYIKKACKENSRGFYDVFKNLGNFEDFDANMLRKKLESFWDDIIENVENHVLPSDFRFQNKWINAGTAYRRLVEPLDIADHYRPAKGNSGSYLSNRPRRHMVLEKWLKDKDQTRFDRGKKGKKDRKMFASLTEDSCFLACEVSKLFDAAEEAFGAVHILVNCAGVLDPKYPPLADTSEEAWDSTFNVNCKGAFLCSREAANRVVKGGGGRIINLSSSVVGSLKLGYGPYAATKAAVETMTKILAKELRGTKITANCVAPGPVATEMFLAGKSDTLVESIAKEIPFERLGEVTDVAPVVAFLASDGGEWINAQVVRVNGGFP